VVSISWEQERLLVTEVTNLIDIFNVGKGGGQKSDEDCWFPTASPEGNTGRRRRHKNASTLAY
jgi:hypothetical protein